MFLITVKSENLALRSTACLLGALTLLVNPVLAHDDSEHCVAIKASINEAGFSN